MRFSASAGRHWLFSGVSSLALLAVINSPSYAETSFTEGDAGYETVVVTGEKVSRSLQDTVSSVAVTTAKKIDQEGITDLFDVITRTANVSDVYGGMGFSIRGISNRGVSGGGEGGLATIYVDDVAVPDVAVFGGPRDMWDVSQVEILRGPQSTVQGRNSLAGAIIVRTQEPTMQWDAKARSQFNDNGGRQFSMAAGGPIVEDELAFRVAVDDSYSDGFIYNPTHKTNADPRYTLNYRGKLKWTPKALPGLEVDANYTHNTRKSGYVFMYISTAVPDFYHNRLDFSDSPNKADTKMDMASLKASYAIAPAWNISSITALSRVRDTSQYDTDYSAVTQAYGTLWRDVQTFSEELRLQYEGDRLKGLFGLFYFDRNNGNKSASVTNVVTPTATLRGLLVSNFGLDGATATTAANLYTTALPVIPVSYTSDAPQKTRTYAVFADGRYSITPDLTLLAGFRYDYEENNLISAQTASFAGTYPTPNAYGAYAPAFTGLNYVVSQIVASAGSSAPARSESFGAFLPKLGLTYRWDENFDTSFVVQRGYRSGGAQVNVARSTIVPYDPEYTWNYELSLRSAWLDGTLTANANAYYVDWSKQQVVVRLGLNTYDYQTENAGKSHMYGVEFELNHHLTDDFDWYGSAGYSQNRFDDFTVNTGTATTTLAGTHFASAPNWTLAAGFNYRFLDGFALNLNASYRGRVFSANGADQRDYLLGGRTLVNGKLSYAFDQWSVYLYANNIADMQYMVYRYKAQNVAILGDPRVIGGGLEFHL
ncbi:outer membrane receptor protein involved in Fe transport [Rhizomicrobium palustre]|uniref:Outer membrane receptor protein involved in Fe transport n=1 Tax=Rhizomicrobium palustre TaxID=189966 RepID=A0A846N327_9PROT|nr:TonB-dependent receptor [Rhizomicrobium palustre]NIK89919.1 outer membrane receptor protein involved in Fe transport [Rhizomicrobium palustre]